MDVSARWSLRVCSRRCGWRIPGGGHGLGHGRGRLRGRYGGWCHSRPGWWSSSLRWWLARLCRRPRASALDTEPGVVPVLLAALRTYIQSLHPLYRGPLSSYYHCTKTPRLPLCKAFRGETIVRRLTIHYSPGVFYFLPARSSTNQPSTSPRHLTLPSISSLSRWH